MVDKRYPVAAAVAHRDSIRESIRTEVAKEVQARMRAQMHEHLPVPLEAQARESREQLAEVQYALKNSYVPPPNAPITHHHRQGARFVRTLPTAADVREFLLLQGGPPAELESAPEPEQPRRLARCRRQAGRLPKRPLPHGSALFVLVRRCVVPPLRMNLPQAPQTESNAESSLFSS